MNGKWKRGLFILMRYGRFGVRESGEASVFVMWIAAPCETILKGIDSNTDYFHQSQKATIVYVVDQGDGVSRMRQLD